MAVPEHDIFLLSVAFGGTACTYTSWWARRPFGGALAILLVCGAVFFLSCIGFCLITAFAPAPSAPAYRILGMRICVSK